MPIKHLFKLSAISAALLGFSSVGYAIECSMPISIDNQKNASLVNCHVERLENYDDSYSLVEPLLMSVNNQSDLTIKDSNISYRSYSSSAKGILDIRDSKVTIQQSELSAFAPPPADLLKAVNSELVINDSILKGIDGVEIFDLNNTKLSIDNSQISHRSRYDNIFYIHRGTNSTIDINNSTIQSAHFLSDYGELHTIPEGMLTFNINKSKVLAERLFESTSIQNAGSINFNVTDSELSGRMIMRNENGVPLNVVLNHSEWTLPYGVQSSGNSVNHLTLNGGKVILPINMETYPKEKQVFQDFTVYGNLSGSGHFNLTTDLANQQADKIIVKGEDSGDFTLGIQDSSNEPNAANGKVTLVETQQGKAKFSLKDRDYVDAGAYRYRLSQDGTNWILSNRAGETNTQPEPTSEPEPQVEQPVVAETVEKPAVETPVAETVKQPTVETLVPVVVTPVIPAVVETMTNDKPREQPAMAVLSEKSNALVSLHQAQGLLISQNLQGIHQRLGELKTDKSSNVWVKNVNGRTNAKAQNVAVDSRSSGFEMDYHHLQIGADRAVSENVRLGGFVGTSRADIDFKGEYGKGKLRSQAVGLYGTFANENGWYWDNVAKYERLTAQSASTDKRKYNAFSLSSELGKQIAFGNQWTLAPQAQLAYHSVSSKSDEDRVNLFSVRTGLRLAKGIELGNWTLQPYAEVNGMVENSNAAKVRVNQYQFSVPEHKNRVQTAFGLTAGNGSHRVGLELSQTHGKQVRQPFSLLANYRYQW